MRIDILNFDQLAQAAVQFPDGGLYLVLTSGHEGLYLAVNAEIFKLGVRSSDIVDLTSILLTESKQVFEDYTIQLTDGTVIARVGATITLPPVAEATNHVFNIKNGNLNLVTVVPALGATIDGELSQPVPSGSSITVQSDGTEWRII
jgi:hypothetical protein